MMNLRKTLFNLLKVFYINCLISQISLDLIGRRPQVFSLQQNANVNSSFASLINVPHATHPEIQRINSLMQNNCIRFDNEGPRNIEEQAPIGSQQNPLRLMRINGDEELVEEPQAVIQNNQAQSQAPPEATTVFDRIHDTVSYLQSSQYLEDNSRRSEFHENFFDDIRRPNEGLDIQDRGLQAIRTLRDLFEAPMGGNGNATFENLLAIPLGGRGNRMMRPMSNLFFAHLFNNHFRCLSWNNSFVFYESRKHHENRNYKLWKS